MYRLPFRYLSRHSHTFFLVSHLFFRQKWLDINRNTFKHNCILEAIISKIFALKFCYLWIQLNDGLPILRLPLVFFLECDTHLISVILAWAIYSRNEKCPSEPYSYYHLHQLSPLTLKEVQVFYTLTHYHYSEITHRKWLWEIIRHWMQEQQQEWWWFWIALIGYSHHLRCIVGSKHAENHVEQLLMWQSLILRFSLSELTLIGFFFLSWNQHNNNIPH